MVTDREAIVLLDYMWSVNAKVSFYITKDNFQQILDELKEQKAIMEAETGTSSERDLILVNAYIEAVKLEAKSWGYIKD